jgi:S1-C subfamily serine protease
VRRVAPPTLLAAVALLAGCGGSGDESSPAVGAQQGGGGPPQVVVETATSGFNPAEIYRKASPGVVTIRSVFEGGGLLGGAQAAEGSGIVLSKDGEIVTNAHVVTNESGSEREEAKQVFVVFNDLNTVSADIVGYDPFSDVALLKIDPDGLDLHTLQLGSDQDLVTGQPVAAIGDPFFEEQSLSVGVISATDRSVESLTQFQIQGAIQTDASINPGNSGGPLLDANARVIGINEQIRTRSGSNAGVGFAVPVSAVKRSLAQLRENGEAKYAYIGVSSQALYPQLAEHLDIDTSFGSLLSDVVPGGPADKAGLQGGNKRIRFQAGSYKVGGDVIVAVNGKKVIRPDDLARLISALSPGDEVTLDVIHGGGDREAVKLTLGVRPDTIPTG